MDSMLNVTGILFKITELILVHLFIGNNEFTRDLCKGDSPSEGIILRNLKPESRLPVTLFEKRAYRGYTGLHNTPQKSNRGLRFLNMIPSDDEFPLKGP
jgi:hypothetical protein